MICTLCGEPFKPTPYDLKLAEDPEVDPCCPLCRFLMNTVWLKILDLEDSK
jgi:hypothetical protein